MVRDNMKDIEGYEGRYAITEDGQVWSYYSKSFIYQRTNNEGYKLVRLRKNGQQKLYSVHQLVARTFIPNPNEYTEINHIDENKANNTISNLEWCTHQQNMLSGSCRERFTEKQKKTHPNRRAVLCVETQKIYSSMKEAQRETGIDNAAISKCCNHKRETAGGFHWKFIN